MLQKICIEVCEFPRARGHTRLTRRLRPNVFSFALEGFFSVGLDTVESCLSCRGPGRYGFDIRRDHRRDRWDDCRGHRGTPKRGSGVSYHDQDERCGHLRVRQRATGAVSVVRANGGISSGGSSEPDRKHAGPHRAEFSTTGRIHFREHNH